MGPGDEGWPPEVNVQGADGDYQNLGKGSKKRWRKALPANGRDLWICYESH